jgi:hypothetical protein
MSCFSRVFNVNGTVVMSELFQEHAVLFSNCSGGRVQKGVSKYYTVVGTVVMNSSGILRHIARYKSSDVSEEHVAYSYMAGETSEEQVLLLGTARQEASCYWLRAPSKRRLTFNRLHDPCHSCALPTSVQKLVRLVGTMSRPAYRAVGSLCAGADGLMSRMSCYLVTVELPVRCSVRACVRVCLFTFAVQCRPLL